MLTLICAFVVALPVTPWIAIAAALDGVPTIAGHPAQTAASPPAAQTPPAQTPPAGTAPAPAAPRRPRPAGQRPAAATRAVVNVEVTDTAGAPVPDAAVRVTGPVEREATTGANGTATLQNLRAGTYRVRFDAEGFVSFERELVVPAQGRAPALDVVLNRAEAETPEADAATAPTTGTDEPSASDDRARPIGQPQVLDVTQFIERNFIGRSEPQKVSQLGCTGYATSRLVQIREPLERRAHDDADETLFVVAGQVTITLGGREQTLEPNGLVVVPRTTEYSVARRGRNPAILLSVLSGPPCGDAAAR